MTAHDSITAGDMDIVKTKQRLMNYFYWPGISKDVAQHIKRCKICQLTSPVCAKERVPLQPIPVLDAPPFTNLTIDVMGRSLPKTSRGNKNLLIICCNVTKYVQAYALRNLKASTICDKNLNFLACLAYPLR